MRISRVLWLAFVAIVACRLAAPQTFECPVTKAPDPQFVPPAPWRGMSSSDGHFLFGTADLWAVVTSPWNLRGGGENKVPFLSQLFDWREWNGSSPPLAVKAHRLDSRAPDVWSKRVNGGSPSFVLTPELAYRLFTLHDFNAIPIDRSSGGGGFMVTSFGIPGTGCWEISAQFTPDRDKVHTLSYVVLVEP